MSVGSGCVADTDSGLSGCAVFSVVWWGFVCFLGFWGGQCGSGGVFA